MRRVPGFPTVARSRPHQLETGTRRSADEYLDAAQLALQDGFPMEAVRIIDKGYAPEFLGTEPRLRGTTA